MKDQFYDKNSAKEENKIELSGTGESIIILNTI